MAELVGAFATSHVLFGSPVGDDQALRVVDGMNEIGRRVRALDPDLLVVVGSDHLFNITTKLQPPFTVGVSDTFTPFGDMDIERRPFPGHRAFAQALCRRAADSFDLAQAEELRPDHGVMVPLMFVNPEGTTPVVPLLVNTNMDPAPSPARCAALGEVVARTVAEDLPAEVRVVALATGGLSHWINLPRHGEVNAAFDERVIEALASGDLGDLSGMGVPELLDQAGNGGLEIVNWIMVAAMAAGRGWRGERIYYEPMPQWMTGMGGMAFR
ncbi:MULTISPECIES: subunit of meta cleavage enzyme [Sphingomonadaceae]|uniref:Catalytic subunit of meta cleavage enzyme n=2 Tax=Sphingomonas adhaesiva TaxID=28212 RepID=A0A2A4I281_9SPHN|nr:MULTISPECIES: subunit of meta cleavage enzyme [Sphingomonadaceae]PCG13097.1 catalytic subunit of meta cleavage enzyme [Sphingomonas adhaesiva]QSR20429.1 hypothetical protein CA833_25170 [Novosphingobium sp. KA1]BAE75866.1 subunit of meta cleavage enzyme [Novosphingobium sp. KA1]BAF03232.1 subunit of meta cleavage enzyme [Novosphingobium sp. KA1]